MKDKKYNNAEEYNSDNINDIIQERKKIKHYEIYFHIYLTKKLTKLYII